MRKTCTVCDLEFEAKRSAAKYCSERCKKRSQRRPQSAKPAEVVPLTPQTPEEPSTGAGAVAAATLAELEAADRASSPAGQAALALARRIDAGDAETGSAMASLVREYRATLADAVKDAQGQKTWLDELRERRELKRASG